MRTVHTGFAERMSVIRRGEESSVIVRETKWRRKQRKGHNLRPSRTADCHGNGTKTGGTCTMPYENYEDFCFFFIASKLLKTIV